MGEKTFCLVSLLIIVACAAALVLALGVEQ